MLLRSAACASAGSGGATRAVCALALAGALGFVLYAAPTPRGVSAGATITGKVTATGGRLPDVIVYLESRDSAFRCPAPAESAQISQRGARFSPALLVVCVGQTVDFLNDEESAIEHNVFSKSDTKAFDLGLYKPGVSRSVTFDKPGPVPLACSIHKNMSGVIFVAPTPWHARVADDGSFTIPGVPPGAYEVKTFQRPQRYVEVSQSVDVAGGEPRDVTLELRRN